jgi:hypothetical protein
MVLHEFRGPHRPAGQSPSRLMPAWFAMLRPSGKRGGTSAKERGLPRPLSPSRRTKRAHMSRNAFIRLAAGWAGAIAALLAAALVVRWLG